MARPGPSRGQLHVGRYFGALLLLFALIYTGVVLGGPGNHPLKPKLALDLSGGAQVILTPKTKATAGQLSTAVDILRLRVNGAGVSEADVHTEGSNIVVQVPGGNRESIKNAAQAAQLEMRQVLEAEPVGPPVTPVPTATATATPTAATASPTATTNRRPLSAALLAATPTPTPAATPTPTPTASAPADAVPVRSGDVYSPTAYALLDCTNPKELAGGAAPHPTQEIIACDRFGTEKFHLAVPKVVGKDVKGANVGAADSTGITIAVNVQFKNQDKFTKLTQEVVSLPAPKNRVAVVLDGVSYSAPTIQSVINSDAQITGGFTQKTAQDLANVLKFGALPVAFEAGDAEVISASLGDDQLRSGLLAGGIGLAAVVLYSLLYYRALGIVTIFSLLVSGGLTYGLVCLLGKELDFALSLAGIAGFIVAVGITADSFVVYFERLKDEIKEGRTPRSAVDRAWVRARRTILSADTVSLLAAAILYVVSVGSVRGFAATLFLSTVLDIVVVFLFTRPLISYLSRYRWFSRSRLTGFFGPDGGEPSLGGARKSLASANVTPNVQEA